MRALLLDVKASRKERITIDLTALIVARAAARARGETPGPVRLIGP